jgi:sodium/bile acid cotransporter 7
VVALFFISGLTLNTRELFRELRNVKVHAYVHLFTFLLFPLVVLATRFPFDRYYGGQLTLGLYLLAAVPITISSCIALTTVAGGNRAAALFNAVSTNMLGIVLSPFLFKLLARMGDLVVEVDALAVLLKLVKIVIVPFAVGQLVRPWRPAAAFADRHRAAFSRASMYVILFIVYLGFCGTVTRMRGQPAGSGIGTPALVGLGGYLLALNVALLLIITLTARLMRFGKQDRIALLFSAPQKTLALGLPMVISICESSPDLSVGVLSIPVIMYHPIQLVVASIIKDWEL